jgi:hypothetical protein
MKKIAIILAISAALSACKKDTNDIPPLQCDFGYEGAACKDEMRVKFFGTYTASDACNAAPYTMKLYSHPSQVSTMYVTNFDRSGDTLMAILTSSTKANILNGATTHNLSLVDGNLYIENNSCNIIAVK